MANRSDEAVHKIAKRARDDEETAQQGPGPAQPPRDSQRGRRPQINLAVLDRNEAARRLASHPIRGQERRGLMGLRRAKSKIALRVARRDELYGTLAERAGSVEEHNGAGRRRQRGRTHACILRGTAVACRSGQQQVRSRRSYVTRCADRLRPAKTGHETEVALDRLFARGLELHDSMMFDGTSYVHENGKVAKDSGRQFAAPINHAAETIEALGAPLSPIPADDKRDRPSPFVTTLVVLEARHRVLEK